MPPPPPTAPPGDRDQPEPIGWEIEYSTGSADAFHHRDPDADATGEIGAVAAAGSATETPDRHRLWIHTTPSPVLILGSTQPDELIRRDRAAADGIEVCRRRSGGGLVYLDPATDCWVDAIVPIGSPLWQEDVGRAFHWMGAAWVEVLDDVLGPGGPALLHRGRPRATGSGSRRPARSLWCFDDLGHGEVTIGGSKVVGLSQRRTRRSARLQSLVLGRWPGRRLLPYLDPRVVEELAGSGEVTLDPGAVLAGPPPGIRLPAPTTLAAAFVARLTG